MMIMKKMIFTLAMFLGLGSSVAFANDVNTRIEITTPADEFTSIELKDLPQAVQETLAKDFANQAIKAAAVAVNEEAGTSTYKVTLEGEDSTETIVLLSDKGEILE